jgi:HAE1 family hydrophobic/amphiphilic exporter-1
VNLIRLCIERPVGVSVGVLLLVLFGTLALFTIPVQLTPNVDVPKITVNTNWIGANPQEIESEIVERQEEQLRSVKGLREMRSTCRDGNGTVELEFYNDVDRDVALRDVTDKLRQVTGYPPEVDEPTVFAADTARDSEIAWLILFSTADAPGADLRNPELYDFADDYIKPYLDRVEGVGSTDIYGGRRREVHVLIDAGNLAARGITYQQVEAALRGQNLNVSAGTVRQGKRDYAIRTVGQYDKLPEIEDTVVTYTPAGPVYVKDIATVELTYAKQYGFVRSKGEYVLAFPVRREVGANVITVMEKLRAAIRKINREVLEARKLQLELVQVYDETIYIDQAIELLRSNIVVGGALATTILLIFLRNWRATLIVMLSIPISVIGTFLFMASTGRTMNVVSLAGLAFAVGMVVDNAIVVLENIYRHHQMGKGALQSAFDGANEVWAAVLASALTTMVVFIPVIFLREEAGQLFQDISVAVVASVGLSLVIAITVIPTVATRLLALGSRGDVSIYGADQKLAAVDDTGEVTTRYGRWVSHWVGLVCRSPAPRAAIIGGMTGASLLLIPWLVPETTYLPAGNRNLVFGFLVTPPGYSVEEFKRMADVVEAVIRPYWEARPGSPEQAALDRKWREMVQARIDAGAIPELVTDPNEPFSIERRLQRRRLEREWLSPPPLIDNFFFVSFAGGCFMGCSSRDSQRVKPLVRLLRTSGGQLPGVYPIFVQTQIFRFAGGNNAEVQIRGDNLDEVVRSAGAMFGAIMQELKVTPRPTPANFNLGRPEVQIHPSRERTADLGMTVRDVGLIIDACVEGAYVGEYRFQGGDTIDIRLKVRGQDERPTQNLAQVPIATPTGRVVPLSAAVTLLDTTALEQIYRVERQRAVTLSINPPETITLQRAIEHVEQIEAQLRDAGAIPPSVIVSLTGNADKLVTARNTMVGQWRGLSWTTLFNIASSRFFLSVLICYLLMCALYESWVYPFVILFSVPLALFGGFLGLTLCHWGTLLTTDQPVQQFDVVTFLGFVILVGVVVNNAILLVDQALQNMRLHGKNANAAIMASVASRVRPILMTSLTTIAGQLPLAIWPGAGSELYRGLAAVMVGGMLISTLGTLVLVPAVLSVVLDVQARLRRGRRVVPVAARTASERR